MKNLSFLFFIYLNFFLLQASFSQSEILFEKTSHSFGSIKEENGPVTYVFKFKNNGKSTIKLLEVKPSCGCTTPEWTKDDIPPSAEGFVSATYDPTNRPGEFNKSITVKTSGTPAVLSLQISGEVLARPKGPEDWYPSKSGNLRLKTDYIYFGNLLHDKTDTASTILYNDGPKPIIIFWDKFQLPAHLKIYPENLDAIAPNQTLKVVFEFNAKIKNDWGYVFDLINYETDDEAQPRKRFSISADIKENFSHLKDADKRPKISFDKKEHNFGDVLQNTQSTTSFTIKNIGDAPLIIRKCKATCGCTASQPKKMTLQPGESTVVDVSYSSGSQEGNQNKSINIIANDPANPETNLTIKANVLKQSSK